MNNMNVTYDDNGTEMIPVPEWMKSHQYYNEMSNGGRHAYPLHTGAVGIPGLCKGCRIVSLKVPPLFHPEYDIGTEYGLLDWIDDIQDTLKRNNIETDWKSALQDDTVWEALFK